MSAAYPQLQARALGASERLAAAEDAATAAHAALQPANARLAESALRRAGG